MKSREYLVSSGSHAKQCVCLYVLAVEGYECEQNHTLYGSRGQLRSSMYPVPTVAAMCEWWNINALAQITIR